MFWFWSRFVVLIHVIGGIKAIPCTWNKGLTEQQRIQRNCGFICPDPWFNLKDPHYCGAPHSCCCQPSCDIEEAKKKAFIGINWSDQYMLRPLPRTYQFQILKNNGFKHIKTFSISGISDIAKVFGNNQDDVYLHVGITNVDVVNYASDMNTVRQMVRESIVPYKNIIRTIIVGNEPFICIKSKDWAAKGECGQMELPAKVLVAMKNINSVIKSENLTEIKVTTALNGGILTMALNPWTPCISNFRDSVIDLLIPLWTFLRENKAPFIVNLYTWFAATQNAISVNMAVGKVDDTSALDGNYEFKFNFDTQIEMLRIALCKYDVEDLELWIGETGWPSGMNEKANTGNAEFFIRNVVRRAKGELLFNHTKRTTRFDGMPFTVFLFEAFDERKKSQIEHGNLFENTFGLIHEDGIPKFPDTDGTLKLEMFEKKNVSWNFVPVSSEPLAF